MDVCVAESFPRVIRYEMKEGELAGKVFYGQTEEINTIRINGIDIALDAGSVNAEFSENQAVYTMTVKDEENCIDAVITAKLTVEDNIVSFDITDIQNNLTDSTVNKYGQKVETYPIETIAVPDHSLISVRSDQENANLKGAAMSSHTHKSGDESIAVDADMEEYTVRDYLYAFLSNSELSARLSLNT